MTTTVLAPSALPAVAVAPATPFRRRALAATAVAGGLVTTAGFVATVWETGTDKLSYLDSLVVDPLRSQLAAVLLHFGYCAIVPVLLVLGIMTRQRWRVAGNVGLALSMIGALSLPGLLVTDFYDLAIRQNLPADQAVVVSDAAQNLPLALFIAGPMILLTFVGMILLSVAAWRAGFFHWTAGLLVVAANVIPIVVPIGAVQGISQGVCLGLFMVLVGIAAFRMTDQEWVSGARGAGR
jgi:hypothetical protein